MGSRIARRLLDAGHDVVVWNRTPARAEGFPRVAATPAEAARGAKVTITMVSNPQALREVTAGIAPQTLIEMSTVGPAAIHELADALPDGTDLLDAPVLGSRSEADAAPELRLAQAARSWLAEADDASWGERDYSALVAWILDVADEQKDQRDDENDEEPAVDREAADEREDDQQQGEKDEQSHGQLL